MAEGSYVAYYRVSTDRQGRSGLGLEAQKEAVARYLDEGDWNLIGEYVEVESGKSKNRPGPRRTGYGKDRRRGASTPDCFAKGQDTGDRGN